MQWKVNYKEEIMNIKCDTNIKSITSTNEKFWVLIKNIIIKIFWICCFFKVIFSSSYLGESVFSCNIVIKVEYCKKKKVKSRIDSYQIYT